MKDVQLLHDSIRPNVNLDVQLPPEYRYMHLPLCVIDAVFSINANYTSVQNVVSRYCRFSGIKQNRTDFQYPDVSSQWTIEKILSQYRKHDSEYFAEKIYQNFARTSTRNGILKAQAVYRFCQALADRGINNFQDMASIDHVTERLLETSITHIPGQGSGISYSYFLMLTGNESIIKPDRHIHDFIESSIGHEVTNDEAQDLLSQAASMLKMSPRHLDYCIWKYQSS